MRTKDEINADKKLNRMRIAEVTKRMAKMDSPELIAEYQQLQADGVKYQQELEQLQQHQEELEAAASAEYRKQVARQLQEAIEQHDIVQIVGNESYYIKKDGKLLERNFTKLEREILFCAGKPDVKNDFHMLLAAQNRNFNTVTFSFRDTDPDVFNLATGVREKWLKPVEYTGLLHEYKCPDAIDVLLNSLSDGDITVRTYLEQSIARKYRHPEDYKLPSLLLFGQGGVGKNEFVTEFLETIFKNSTVVTNFTTLTQNATICIGKVIVLVDETLDVKADYEKFKQIAGNRTVEIKTLYKDKFNIDNVMWLIVTGNAGTGPMTIQDDSTTRRITPISYANDLFYWLSKHIGIDFDNSQETKQHFTELWSQLKARDFTDENVAQWLGYVLAKFPYDEPVVALHTEVYEAMVNAGKSPLDVLVSEVINCEYIGKPTAFSFPGLYQIYKHINSHAFNNRLLLSYNKFTEAMAHQARCGNMPGWVYKERARYDINGKKGDKKYLINTRVGITTVKEHEDLDMFISPYGDSLFSWQQDNGETGSGNDLFH